MTTNQEFCQNEDGIPNSLIGNVTTALLSDIRGPYSPEVFKMNDCRKARTDQTYESLC